MKPKIMIIAGEASGDLHASGLIREILRLRPEIEIFGIGGDKMRQQGVDLLYHITEMSVVGFIDVIKRFAFFRKVYSELVQILQTKRPNVLILIDYPGLNLKLANAARKLGIQVFYYIAPQVWAWGTGRIKKMAKLIDNLAVILPFEKKLFQDAGIRTHFVGHPLLEVLSTKMTKDEFCKSRHLNKNEKIIGLLPGSRILEVKRLLPELIKTAMELKNRDTHLQIVIGRSSSVTKALYQEIVDNNPAITILDDSTYEVMKYSDLLLVASGTATLESALFETPLMIVYRVDPLSYFIAKQLVKIKNIGLVNVIAGKQIVPEFIQYQFTSANMIPVAEKLLFDQNERQRMIAELKLIKQKLGEIGASKKAAEIALSMI